MAQSAKAKVSGLFSTLTSAMPQRPRRDVLTVTQSGASKDESAAMFVTSFGLASQEALPEPKQESWASASSASKMQAPEQQVADLLRSPMISRFGSKEALSDQVSGTGDGTDHYDEALQDAVYLQQPLYVQCQDDAEAPLPLPQKNTFIHFDVLDSSLAPPVEGGDKNWNSSPAKVLNKSFHTKHPAVEEAHLRGDCKPCAYYLYKPDGCRQGVDCEFCHLCKRGDIKRKKLAISPVANSVRSCVCWHFKRVNSPSQTRA